MKRELEIQKLLRQNGLEATVSDLRLIYKIHADGRVLFKYRQIEADWNQPATHECRGLILDMNNNWEVVSYPYDKFFNAGEVWCKEIDWSTIKWMTKEDGSLMTLYFWKDSWRIQSSGLIEAEKGMDLNMITLADLFRQCATDMYGSFENLTKQLDTENCYMFEMMTPENLIVVQHKDYKIKLHGIRSLKTLEELSIESLENIHKVDFFEFKDLEDVRKTAIELSWNEEGFVGVDKNFNRIKVKGPAYVARHYASTSISKYAILDVIRANELDEYFVYFKTKQDNIRMMEANYKKFIKDLDDAWLSVFIDLNGSDLSKKEFSAYVEKTFTGYFKAFIYSMVNRKYENAKEYVDSKITNKVLFKIIEVDDITEDILENM